MIKSPITGSENTKFEREIPSSVIIAEYQKELGVDISRFFNGLKNVSIYTCLDTGYRFYYPFNIAGDDAFYQSLEHFPWYYIDWKWEHTIAEKFVKNTDNVLEIGCARGGFLRKIRNSNASVEGLEMNSDALNDCVKNNLLVHSETIEKFAPNKKDMYDVICSFQVLEHVPDVKSFIESSCFALKPGGLMIVSVPNNDSFILRDSNVVLDMPPHHMGLWNINSLIKLQNNFPLILQDMYIEPLQPYHLGYAQKYAEKKLDNKLTNKFGALKKIILPFVKKTINLTISAHNENMIGQTVLVVYRKTK